MKSTTPQTSSHEICSPATKNAIIASFCRGVGRSTLLNAAGSLTTARDSQDAIEIVQGIARPSQNIEPRDEQRRAQAVFDLASKMRIRIYSVLDAEFPACLVTDYQPPFFMTCRSEKPELVLRGGLLDQWRGLGVIGTREATQQGKDATEWLVRMINEECDTIVTPIVSGLAEGIDITAHRAAINNYLPTVAVMAGGLEKIYPKIHTKDTEDIIAKGGALVSEYLPGAFVSRSAFVERDRIQAMYSRAMVAMQCGEKSGTFYAMSAAAKMGRSLFAFQHKEPKTSLGTDQLIAGTASDNAGKKINAQAAPITFEKGIGDIIQTLGRSPST